MAARTRIKNLTSSSSNAPTILKTGEFGYSYGAETQANGGGRLYIGAGAEDGNTNIAATQQVIGGKYFVDMLDHVHGELHANSALITNASSALEQLKVDLLDIDGSTISTQSNNVNITVSPHGTGKAIIVNPYVGTDQVSLAEYIRDTVGGTVVAGTGITVTPNDAADTTTVSITATLAEASSADDTAGEYGDTNKIPQFTVNRQGQITEITELDVATVLNVAAGSGTGNGVDLLTDTLTISGTANEIETSISGDTVSIGLPNNVTISNNLTVTGNLTVDGTTTTVNSTTVTIDDPIFTLGGDTAPSADDGKDRGIEFRYHDGTNPKLGYFGFDKSDSTFVFIPDATNSNEVFSGNAGSAKFAGLSLTTALTVSSGGTGRSTLTNNAVLIGNGTDAVTQLSGNQYEILQAGASGVPAFSNIIDGGTY